MIVRPTDDGNTLPLPGREDEMDDLLVALRNIAAIAVAICGLAVPVTAWLVYQIACKVEAIQKDCAEAKEAAQRTQAQTEKLLALAKWGADAAAAKINAGQKK